MTLWKSRALNVGLLAGACAFLLDGAGMLSAGQAFADDSGDYTALIMGHAFLSQPDATYMQEVIDTYIDNPVDFMQPQYAIAGDPVSVYTPETDYGSGLIQGVQDLDNQLQPLLAANSQADIVVGAYSMSNSIATQEMINLAAEGVTDPNLKFVLAENLNNPDGGYFTRFPGAFGVNLPATPANTPFDTTIYSIEYSGASDYPEYDGNMWADMNASAGYIELHPYLLPGWPAYFNPAEVTSAVLDPKAPEGITTEYYLIPTQNLPMLDGLGTSAFTDLMQPDMRVLVDLGYDWTGDPSVATAATSANPDIDFTAVDSYMAAGADQGMIAFLADLGILPQSDLLNLYPYVPDVLNLENGELTNETMAAMDASTSASALTSDLASSTNPLAADFATFAPSMATSMADYYDMLASSL